MSEFDSKALERVLDQVLPVHPTLSKIGQTQTAQQRSVSSLVQLEHDKHLGSGEADELGGVVAMVHAKPRPQPKAVMANIDELVDRGALSTPVALTVAAVLRRLAEIAAAQDGSGSSVKAGLISQEQQEMPEFDWGDASDTCVEGAGWGGTIGAGLGMPEGGIGAVPGAVFGAIGGCVVAVGIMKAGYYRGGGTKW